MIGHGEKLTRKQDDAIAALLSTATIKDAAAACNVGVATLYRWLQLPEFAAAYRTARREVVEHAITELQSATSEAVATLKRNLNCRNEAVEVRAASIVLEQAIKGVELMDLQERIEKLETRIEETEGRTKRWA
jgi:transposase-like protein